MKEKLIFLTDFFSVLHLLALTADVAVPSSTIRNKLNFLDFSASSAIHDCVLFLPLVLPFGEKRLEINLKGIWISSLIGRMKIRKEIAWLFVLQGAKNSELNINFVLQLNVCTLWVSILGQEKRGYYLFNNLNTDTFVWPYVNCWFVRLPIVPYLCQYYVLRGYSFTIFNVEGDDHFYQKRLSFKNKICVWTAITFKAVLVVNQDINFLSCMLWFFYNL